MRRVRAYKPTSDVENKIKSFTKEIFGADFENKNLNQIQLTDPINKFNVLKSLFFTLDISNSSGIRYELCSQF